MIGALILGGTELGGVPAAPPATKPGRIVAAARTGVNVEPGTRTSPTIAGGA